MQIIIIILSQWIIQKKKIELRYLFADYLIKFRSVRLVDTGYLRDTQLSMCLSQLTETLQSFLKLSHSDLTDGLKSENT